MYYYVGLFFVVVVVKVDVVLGVQWLKLFYTHYKPSKSYLKPSEFFS
ncbi:hypothetical protein MuYL_3423 [Mucilaginibacter xinganensis]|uniref:Uncharacterized protein n=1 Tax=Mucilaginibacter xinganensis TaxID=1234841 RepID=A0A223P0G0_9SPHI|nr:hypothetical protein MuYL_3423 [Mucilaginibacter xinganensis]